MKLGKLLATETFGAAFFFGYFKLVFVFDTKTPQYKFVRYFYYVSFDKHVTTLSSFSNIK